MRKIGVQRIRVKPLQVNIDYTIRLINPQRLEARVTQPAQRSARARPSRQDRKEAESVALLKALPVHDHRKRVADLTSKSEPIPRLRAKSPRVRAVVPSAPAGAMPKAEPQQHPESTKDFPHTAETEPVPSVTPELQPELATEAPAARPRTKRLSVAPKAKAEPAPAPPPVTRLKVIRRRGEQAPKVFETVTREFPSAMLRGIKAMKDQEGENS